MTCDVKKLRVSETFSSLQGESSFAGFPCFFIRLSGCNLRCRYCDTKYAYRPGRPRTVSSLVAEYEASGIPLVEVTGGEPLLQSATRVLLAELVKHGKTLLETNGSFDISKVPGKVVTILDIKCPGSCFTDKNHWQNMKLLRPHDEVKFVICNRKDYDWAKQIMDKYHLTQRCRAVNLSPTVKFLSLPTLAGWIIRDKLPVRLNIQLHKTIWPKAKHGK